jgi:hypothetical protein
MNAFTAFSDDAALGIVESTSAESTLEALSNSLASSSEGFTGGVEGVQAKGESLRAAWGRDSSVASAAGQDSLDVALRTWLSQAEQQVDSDDDAIESKLCDTDSARDAFFESLDTAAVEVGGELAGRKFKRRGARLAALR